MKIFLLLTVLLSHACSTIDKYDPWIFLDNKEMSFSEEVKLINKALKLKPELLDSFDTYTKVEALEDMRLYDNLGGKEVPFRSLLFAYAEKIQSLGFKNYIIKHYSEFYLINSDKKIRMKCTQFNKTFNCTKDFK
jgi:hypothetical protein